MYWSNLVCPSYSRSKAGKMEKSKSERRPDSRQSFSPTLSSELSWEVTLQVSRFEYLNQKEDDYFVFYPIHNLTTGHNMYVLENFCFMRSCKMHTSKKEKYFVGTNLKLQIYQRSRINYIPFDNIKRSQQSVCCFYQLVLF